MSVRAGGAVFVDGTSRATFTRGALQLSAARATGGAAAVSAGSSLILESVSVADNAAAAGAGAIDASGALSLSGCAVDRNSATAGNGGAVIARNGAAISGGFLRANRALVGLGGAVWLGAPPSLSHSTKTPRTICVLHAQR